MDLGFRFGSLTPCYARAEIKFTVIGTIEPRKNHPLVLDAFESLYKKMPELKLSFAGGMHWVDASFFDRVRQLQSQKCGFFHVENADDSCLRSHIENSRATIFVSKAEGFGLPPVESLWLGVPVIAASGLPSLETYGGQGIHEVDPYNEQDLRNALILFSDDSYYRRKALEASELKLPTWASFAAAVADWVTTGMVFRSAGEDAETRVRAGIAMDGARDAV